MEDLGKGLNQVAERMNDEVLKVLRSFNVSGYPDIMFEEVLDIKRVIREALGGAFSGNPDQTGSLEEHVTKKMIAEARRQISRSGFSPFANVIKEHVDEIKGVIKRFLASTPEEKVTS